MGKLDSSFTELTGLIKISLEKTDNLTSALVEAVQTAIRDELKPSDPNSQSPPR
jgi:hypothetical protein